MSNDSIRQLLARMCAKAGSQAAWARERGVAPGYVSDVLCGRKPAGKKMLDAMGVRIKQVIERGKTDGK